MTWTNLTFASGEVLTSSKMSQFYSNFEAFGNGDSGAPTVQTDALVDGDKFNNNFDTATASFSGVISGSSVLITLNAYAFFPNFRSSRNSGTDGAYVSIKGHTTNASDPDSPRFKLYNPLFGILSYGAQNYSVTYRYVKT